ncbi:MAG: ATP-binding cassette domain-containing protein [Bacteroidia bacterium]
MNILKIHEVSKIYANHTALDKVSFDVPKGKIFGLLGPNGAGKTSLIRIINQITAPDHGYIHFDGEELNSNHIKRIGYLPEERGLYKKMQVYDQLLYFARLKGLNKSKAHQTIDYWLEKFEALDWKKKKIEELSKGMQQKIQFIITVLHQPDFIILDEPFTGFDPKNTQLIKDEIFGMKEGGKSVMLSTHRMESVEEICDEVVLINKAKVIRQGQVDSIRHELKEDLFEVIYDGEHDAGVVEGIELLHQEHNQGHTTISFKFKDGVAPNIQNFTDKNIEIKQYRELIPSMQEVFLKLTEEDA